MRSYRRLAENFASSVGAAGTTGSEERAERAERLSQLTYDDVLRDRVAYGTPDMVVDQLRHLRDALGVSGVIMESNVGGRIRSIACSTRFASTRKRSLRGCVSDVIPGPSGPCRVRQEEAQAVGPPPPRWLPTATTFATVVSVIIRPSLVLPAGPIS